MLRLSYLGSHFNMCIRKCLHTWRCITNDIRNHFFFQIPSWYILVSEETHFKGPHCESSEKQVGGGFTLLVPPFFLTFREPCQEHIHINQISALRNDKENFCDGLSP